MTAGELKFAVALESTLNCIPMPEYRQLMVEALMVLSIVCDNDPSQVLDGSVNLDEIVHNANELFLRSQVCVLCELPRTIVIEVGCVILLSVPGDSDSRGEGDIQVQLEYG